MDTSFLTQVGRSEENRTLNRTVVFNGSSIIIPNSLFFCYHPVIIFHTHEQQNKNSSHTLLVDEEFFIELGICVSYLMQALG